MAEEEGKKRKQILSLVFLFTLCSKSELGHTHYTVAKNTIKCI